jgi:acyl transferase domain-containing protein
MPWPHKGLRRASVSSSGFGGTNVHIVLDDTFHYFQAREMIGNHFTHAAPSESATPVPDHFLKLDIDTHALSTNRPKLFVWSVNEKSSVANMHEIYRNHLEQLGAAKMYSSLDMYLDSLAFTLTRRRTLHSWRVEDMDSRLTMRKPPDEFPISVLS